MAPPDPSTVRFAGTWTHRDIHANGIRFHTVEVGGAAHGAPLVVLLHGFADFWWSWRHQLAALSEAGYRAVAVDLRGYGDTDKPPRGYDGWTLAGDVAGLIRAMGYPKATLVGHADGGLVCWATAVLHPHLVHSIVPIGSPHPIALRQGVLRDRRQRSALMPSFVACQLPFRPERRLTRDGGAEVERIVRTRSGPDWQRSFEYDDVIAKMRTAIRIPGTAHCTLEYQRWAFRSQFRPDGRRFLNAMDKVLTLPVMQLHGALDPFVLSGTIRRGHRYAPRQKLVSVGGAGHYAHWESPEFVNAALTEFLAAH
ncbi:alpha/beta fold hydrolase [Rhodococcus sp. NPDC058521]|uniref:alpha/beta fold hydrolase n=1 Tax=Rhodococcus sp. NPDC058521 TaxID=3346536 RepID=UPI00365A3B61